MLRRGSSRISEENFNGRLQREKAKSGAVSVSLAWNDPSDLDLEASVYLEKGGMAKIYYGNKQVAGGYLDVDMHARDGEESSEPVENIFWKKPPAGVYVVQVNLYRKRGTRGAAIPFRTLLKREGEDDLSREGEVEMEPSESRRVEVFRFTVDAGGEVNMNRVGGPLPEMKPGPIMLRGRVSRMRAPMRRAPAPRAMKAKMMKVMKVMKVSKIAKGKRAKAAVWKGKKVKTSGGLKKDDLVKNKKSKIVSKSRQKQGQDSKWARACAKARALKGYTGFKAVKRGGSFYEKAKELMKDM